MYCIVIVVSVAYRDGAISVEGERREANRLFKQKSNKFTEEMSSGGVRKFVQQKIWVSFMVSGYLQLLQDV